jgi:hypothetical protein
LQGKGGEPMAPRAEEVTMIYASEVFPSPGIRLPHIAIPKPSWPRLSPRARALLMMGLMISPVFLSDAIGYCIRRLSYTADQIAEARPHDDAMLSRVDIFHVACGDTTTPAAEQGRWAAYAAQNGWPMYPQAGETCFRPDRILLGVVGLKTFNVACPTLVLSVADRRRWMEYAADHGWDAYPQAGADCVDP